MTISIDESITFVIPVNDNKVYKNNFLASPLFKQEHHHEILVMTNFSSASKAYNAAIDRAANDLVVFSHQDIFFPVSWITDLKTALHYLEKEDPEWGILGCYGVTEDEKRWGFVYSTGWGFLGTPFAHPKPIQTLDEIVLILRKSSDLRFDETLPHFHLYGTDICMEAKENGRKSYVMSCFVIHNTDQIINLNRQFYECYKHVKMRWRKYLPIQTSCIEISRFDREVFARKFQGFYRRISSRVSEQCLRVKDPQEILDRLLIDKRLETADLQSADDNIS